MADRQAFNDALEALVLEHWEAVAPGEAPFGVPSVGRWVLVLEFIDAAVPDNDNDWTGVLRSDGSRNIHIGMLHRALGWLS